MKTTALIDADIVAYQLAATAQRAYKWPGQEAPSVALDEWADQPARIDAEVSKLRQAVKADEVVICLSCPTADNWRLDVLPSYKGNRDYSNRPGYLAAVKDYLAENYPSYRRPRLEADDIMGILSTDPGIVKGKKVIVSEDKDMKTIPGWLFNPRKDRAPQLIGPDTADYMHLYQALVGDATDGYAGCPGIGPVKATNALAQLHPDKRWAALVAVYEKHGLTEAEALIQARVARICRASDYDFNKKEVILWTPS